MEYVNLKRQVIEGEVMQDASAEAVRAWLFLQSYCAGQENGGCIAGAAVWNDRKWLKQCGLSHEVVHLESALWRWEGADLHLEFYPVWQEEKYCRNRKVGACGGRKSGEVRRQKRSAREADGSSKNEANGLTTPEADGLRDGSKHRFEQKEKEKEKEKRKGKGDALSLEVSVPTESEVRTWAEMSGVDPEFAAQKWAAANETHGWERNGRLIEWRARFKRFWEEDRGSWLQKKKAAQKNGAAAPEKNAGWKEGDMDWWWTESRELLEKALYGALIGGQGSAERLREILKVRKETA